MITIRPLMNPGKHEFMCIIDERRHVVIPFVTAFGERKDPPVTLFFNGVPHLLHFDYNVNTHQQDLYLHSNVDPFKGYRGPRVIAQELEVEREVLDTLFKVVLYKRERGSLWSMRCFLKEAQRHLDQQWSLEPPPEKIEDQEYITVCRDGQVTQERNPFYSKPAEATL